MCVLYTRGLYHPKNKGYIKYERGVFKIGLRLIIEQARPTLLIIMNKIISILAIVLALGIGIGIGSTEQSFAEWPWENDQVSPQTNESEVSTPEVRAVGGVTDDVWQESCNPVVVLSGGPSCQQANVIIQQQHRMIVLLESFIGE